MSRLDEATIRRYLQLVRDNPSGHVSRSVMDALRREFNEIWRKIQASPDSYLMTELEFAIFTFFVAEVPNERIAQRARRRYWDSRGGNGGTR